MRDVRVIVTALLIIWSAGKSGFCWAGVDKLSPEQYYAEKIKSRLIAEIAVEDLKKEAKEASKLLEDLKYQKKGEIESRFQGILSQLTAKEEEERNQLIKTLETFLKKYPHSRSAPDIILRLAELYYEKASIEYQRKVAQYQQKLERGELKENELPPFKDYSKSIDLYLKFLKLYPEHRDADIVLYLLGYCWYEMQVPEEALKYFKQIADERFMSRLYDEAAFRAGEIYFNENDLENAVAYYSLIEAHPQSPFYDKALYKLAWSYYKMEDYDNAVRYFLKSIKYFETHKSETSLLQESKEYLAVSLAEKTSVEDAEKFLAERMGPKFAREIVLKISDIYHERGDVQKALEVLFYFLNRYAYSDLVPEVYRKISDYYSEQNQLEKMLEWKDKFIKTFLPDADWYSRAKIGKKKRASILKNVEETIIELAKYYHSEAEKRSDEKAEPFYEKALYYYNTLIKYFPRSYYISDAYFLKGEILFTQHYYLKASDSYKKAAEINIPGIENKYIQQAAYNAIYSLDSIFQERSDMSKKEIKQLIKIYASYAKWYMDLFPFDPRTPAIIYRAGYLLMKHGDPRDAISLFRIIVDNYFNTTLTDDAVKNIIKIYVDLSDYDNLYKTGFEFLARPEILTPEIKEYITGIVGGSLFKAAMKRMEEAKYDEAISLFKRVIARFAGTDLSEKALFNIAVSYEGKGDYSEAINVLEEFAEKYPKSELTVKVLFKLASLYDRVFDFESALKYYTQVYQRFPRAKESKYSLYNAAKINHDLGHYSQAVMFYREYIKRFPKDEKVREFLLSMAECFEKMDSKKEALDIYFGYIKRFPTDYVNVIKAQLWIANYFKTQNEWKKAKKYYTEVLKTFTKLSSDDKKRYAEIAAAAHFNILYRMYEEYDAIKLKLPMKRMKRLLEKKAEMLKKLTEELVNIPQYGDAYWAEGALYLIARAYKDFAEALYDAPVPPGLTPEEEDIYRQELEAQAFPIEDKATEAVKRAIEYAEKLGIENEWVYKSRLLLQELQPGYEMKRADEKMAFAIDDFFYVYGDTTPEKTTFSRLRVAVKEKSRVSQFLLSGKLDRFFHKSPLQTLEKFRKDFYIMRPVIK